METRPVSHPSADVLQAFTLGKLDDSTSSVLMNHLDGCPDCCKVVAALSGDDFLNRLRQAQGRSVTPAPAQSLAHSLGGSKPPPLPSQTPIPNLPPELAANQQYEILRELGRGGMGVVYLAQNKLMDRLEVLKVINKTLLDRPGSVERFLREIRSAAKLSHANVVTAYSGVHQGDLLAFAMEYVEGDDLAKLVKSRGPLPVVHACYYVQQAALGLQHAFENDMVHRDIKPQNLMLSRKGKRHLIKVLDFGLAKARREKAEATGLTGEGAMLGTPDYIAPEQSLDAAHADIRADIYSLGCTFYHLLSGHPPFSAISLGAILLAHQMQEAKPLNLVRPEVPEELAAVVRKMMAKSPAKRYQTPLEVVQALMPFVKPGATAKPAPELSAGTSQAKPAIKVAARVEPPPAPADVWGSLTQDSSASVAPRKSAAIRTRPAAIVRERTSTKKWLLGGGIVVALLLVLAGMWAGGAFKVQRRELTQAVAEHKPSRARPEPLTKEKGFVRLFNGKDLNGWIVDSGDANAWQVKDGEIAAIGTEEGYAAYLNQGYLLTEREYSDMLLRFQFQQVATKYAWGGVALRAVPHETARNADPARKPEFNAPLHLTVIVGQPDPLVGPWVTGSLWWQTGRMPCLPPDHLRELKKIGEWNDMEVEMRGQYLRIAVNGRAVLNIMLNKTRPDANPLPGLSRFSGHIGLLKRVGEIRYRNIEIKDLSEKTAEASLTHSVVGTWDGTFQDGKKGVFIFVQSDHTVTGDNGFFGRWEQKGLNVLVIKASTELGTDRKWEGEIDPGGKTMTLRNDRYGVNTYVRR